MNDFKSIHTITCPECGHTQTGIIKESPGIVLTIPSEEHSPFTDRVFRIPCGTPYIRCAIIYCQHIIVDEQLEEATRTVVQFPSDLRKISIT